MMTMTPRTLKESLTLWTGFPGISGTFEPNHTRRAAVRVAKQIGDTVPRKPEPYDLEGVYKRIGALWNRSRSLNRIEARDLRRLPWVLFYGSNRADWLGADQNMVTQFGEWLSGGYRTGSLRSLLHEFLRVYPTELSTFHEVRQLLRNAIVGSPSPPASLKPWKQRCCDFALLDANHGLSFVDKLVSASNEPDDMLRNAGLEAGLERCGFLRSGILSFLRKASIQLQENRLLPAHLSRLLTLLESNGSLRFDEVGVRNEIAKSLLNPFVERAAEASTRERLQPFFLRHFRDPRLKSGKHNWSGVPDDTRRVVIRWLVERALEQFFEHLKDTALDKHWRYREAFWRAFLKRDLIDDIWFVLGPRAKRSLRKLKTGHGEAETTAALLGSAGDQSVLLLQMPGVTIAEWSHNGSCRFWLDGTRGAPRMYELAYNYRSLTHGADLSQRHDGSPKGRWQDQIAEWLRQNTGIEIDRADYFPAHLREDGYRHNWRYQFR